MRLAIRSTERQRGGDAGKPRANATYWNWSRLPISAVEEERGTVELGVRLTRAVQIVLRRGGMGESTTWRWIDLIGVVASKTVVPLGVRLTNPTVSIKEERKGYGYDQRAQFLASLEQETPAVELLPCFRPSGMG